MGSQAAPAAPASNVFNFNVPNVPVNVPGLMGFQSTVWCSFTTHTEAGCQFHMFTIRSRGEFSNYGNEDYVSRSLRGIVTNRWEDC